MIRKKLSVNYVTEAILKDICHGLADRLFKSEEPMGLYADHDEAKLQASLALPRQEVFGKELYEGVFKKAAVLFYAINRNHAFGNGNKRLSVASLLVFLYMNDIVYDGSNDDLRDKALWLAQTTEPIGDVVEHLAAWIQKDSFTREEYEKVAGPLRKYEP